MQGLEAALFNITVYKLQRKGGHAISEGKFGYRKLKQATQQTLIQHKVLAFLADTLHTP